MIHELASLIDIPPTLLASGTGYPPATMCGRPLQELLSGQAVDWPREVFVQISESQVGRAIRTKRWKYAVSAPDKKDGLDPASELYVEEHLYDLETDPHERRNLVREPDYAAIRGTLSETMAARMAQAGENVPTIQPAS